MFYAGIARMLDTTIIWPHSCAVVISVEFSSNNGRKGIQEFGLIDLIKYTDSLLCCHRIITF